MRQDSNVDNDQNDVPQDMTNVSMQILDESNASMEISDNSNECNVICDDSDQPSDEIEIIEENNEWKKIENS